MKKNIRRVRRLKDLQSQYHPHPIEDRNNVLFIGDSGLSFLSEMAKYCENEITIGFADRISGVMRYRSIEGWLWEAGWLEEGGETDE